MSDKEDVGAGNRGRRASGHAPENTRVAFDLAIEMGADMVETDV